MFADSITPSEHGYHPHLTVAYVKGGTNFPIDGSQWEGRSFEAQMFIYSEPEHTNRLPFNARGKSISSAVSARRANAVAQSLKPLFLSALAAELGVARKELEAALAVDDARLIPALKAVRDRIDAHAQKSAEQAAEILNRGVVAEFLNGATQKRTGTP